MKKKNLKGLIAVIAAASGLLSAFAPASAASLSNSNEWNDLTANKVQPRATDTSEFQTLIPEFQQFVQPEGITIPEREVQKLDPSKLLLKTDNNVRVWFLNEGADYRDQLAYEAIKDSNYQKGFIFPDASCISGNNNNCELPSNDGVLNVGDYVDLGKIAGGTQINFWLRANGANPQDPGATNPVTNVKNIYGAIATQNPDQLDHVVAYEYKDYLLIGFEDLFGPLGTTGGANGNFTADRDFNDVVLVAYFGKDNIATIPEPAPATALLGALAVGMLTLPRRRQK